MSKRHTDALKAKIEEIPTLATKTFKTEAPHATDAPYLVIHPANGVNSQARVTGPRSTRHPRFTLHVVGKSTDQVEVLMDLIEAKLFPDGRGVVMTVIGELSKPLWFESPMPVQKQTDPQPTVIYGVIETGWTADPV